jgi:LacI family transcriptional regulator
MRMKQRRVTSQQVAERAGVSRTTVSFVLNDVESASIPDETRQRVIEAARELHYVPDTAARALAKGRTKTIALVLFRAHEQVFTDPYVPNIISGFNQVAQKHGYRLLVEQFSDFESASVVAELLRSGEAAGVLLSGWVWGHDELLVPLIEAGYPLFSLDDLIGMSTTVPYVTIDHLSGVRSAVRHLISLGHTRIGCVTYGPLPNIHVTRRLQAMQEVMRDAELTVDESLWREGAFEPETGYQATHSLLNESEPPTAIFGMNDLMALGALAAIHEAGLRVPDDIAVIGYDDMRFSGFTTPALSTVHAPEMELGRKAAELMVAQVEGKRWATPKPLSPYLVVRASCGASKKGI